MSDKIELRELPVRLSDSEKLQYGRAIAQLLEDDADAYAAMKAAQAEHAAAKKGRALELERLRVAIQSGRELRAVEVRLERDWARGVVRVIRTDTMDDVEQRPMTMQERQRELEVS